MSGARLDLDRAKQDAERARLQLAATIGEIQHRLSPKVLLTQAWDEIKDKGGLVADDAVKAVKDRPGTVSGIAALVGLFLARKPIGRMVSGLRKDDSPEGTLQADLDSSDTRLDLTAPVLPASPEAPPPPRKKRAKSEGARV